MIIKKFSIQIHRIICKHAYQLNLSVCLGLVSHNILLYSMNGKSNGFSPMMHYNGCFCKRALHAASWQRPICLSLCAFHLDPTVKKGILDNDCYGVCDFWLYTLVKIVGILCWWESWYQTFAFVVVILSLSLQTNSNWSNHVW